MLLNRDKFYLLFFGRRKEKTTTIIMIINLYLALNLCLAVGASRSPVSRQLDRPPLPSLEDKARSVHQVEVVLS